MKKTAAVKIGALTTVGNITAKVQTKLLKASGKNFTHLEIIEHITTTESAIAALDEAIEGTVEFDTTFTPRQINKFAGMKKEYEAQLKLWRHKFVTLKRA